MLITVYRLPASYNKVNFTTSAETCILVREHGARWNPSAQQCRSRACSVRGDRERRICGKASEFPMRSVLPASHVQPYLSMGSTSLTDVLKSIPHHG